MSRVSYNLFILFLLATCGPFYPQDGLFQFARLLSSFVSWVGNTISLMNLWWLPEIHTLSNSMAVAVWLKTWQKGVSEIYICIRILMTDLPRANRIFSILGEVLPVFWVSWGRLPVQMRPSCLSHCLSSHSQYSPDTHQSCGEQIHWPQWQEPANTHKDTKALINTTQSLCNQSGTLTGKLHATF